MQDDKTCGEEVSGGWPSRGGPWPGSPVSLSFLSVCIRPALPVRADVVQFVFSFDCSVAATESVSVPVGRGPSSAPGLPSGSVTGLAGRDAIPAIIELLDNGTSRFLSSALASTAIDRFSQYGCG